MSRRGLDLLRARGLAPKKSFGQHFLHDAGHLARIAELAATPSTVLEIGAGLGALTEALAARAGRVVAVERDRDLVPILRELFADAANVSIVEADAVKLSWRDHLNDSPRVVAGNLPYHITGKLLERAVEQAAFVDRVVFMVQHEVAQRVAAPPGSRTYGMLSVFVQAAFRVERALRVAPGAFVPPPEVSSTVIVLTPHEVPRAEESPLFREVVHAAFATRRKTLRNAWRRLLAPSDLATAARDASIDLDKRAETLSVEDFARMTTAVRACRSR